MIIFLFLKLLSNVCQRYVYEMCAFVCEDFPQENRTLANKHSHWLGIKVSIFYTHC